MIIKAEARKETVTRLVAMYKDFHPEADPQVRLNWWRETYFDLLSWKNTWGLNYELDLGSCREGAYISITLPESYGDHIKDYMEGLGCGNVKAYKETAVILDTEELYEAAPAGAYFVK